LSSSQAPAGTLERGGFVAKFFFLPGAEKMPFGGWEFKRSPLRRYSRVRLTRLRLFLCGKTRQGINRTVLNGILGQTMNTTGTKFGIFSGLLSPEVPAVSVLFRFYGNVKMRAVQKFHCFQYLNVSGV
jgi:hypothetical protein